jgi:hypothetical protein
MRLTLLHLSIALSIQTKKVRKNKSRNHQYRFRESTLNSELLREESTAQFNARIDAEDKECLAIACPLESCGAEIGEPCCTEAGQKRIRHARRLWMVRKLDTEKQS